MTRRTVADLAASVVTAVREHVAGALRPVERRQEDFERRLRALEVRGQSEQRGFFYRGVWDARETYSTHDFATHDGSLWCCLTDNTQDRPGTSEAWQLSVKRGRDGRDARDRR